MACSAHSWKHITHAQIHMRKTAITSSHSLQTRGSQPVHLPSLCGSESNTWWSWVVVSNPSVWYGLSCVHLSTLKTCVIPWCWRSGDTNQLSRHRVSSAAVRNERIACSRLSIGTCAVCTFRNARFNLMSLVSMNSSHGSSGECFCIVYGLRLLQHVLRIHRATKVLQALPLSFC